MADQVFESPTNPHFFQPLLPGFHSHLSIPVDFYSKHIEGRNKKNMVELTSDASEKTWKVKREGRKLTLGWKDFAVAHDYRVGDIIVFKHQGDFVFHVTGLGPSCCEIQYVQPSNDDNDDEEEENIRNLPKKQKLKTEQESLPEDEDKDNMAELQRKKLVKTRIHEGEAESFESDQSCLLVRVTDSNLREDTMFLPKKFVWSKGSNKIILMDEGERKWTLNLRFRESSRTFYMSHGWRNFCHENMLKPGDSVTFKQENDNTKTPVIRFSTSESKKCVSTKDSSKGKKRKTAESSQSRVPSALSETRFVTLTVTPSSYKKSRLYLPASFTRIHKMENVRGKKIIMLDKHGVEWPVYVCLDKRYTRLRCYSGVKAFFKAIDIKPDESFVLELVWEDKTSPPILKFCSKIKT
ncbi:hypothetical protein AALP_AA7G175100 [Arabis alpina]|uniref:TF-B3 domain-containing protein n=1 Tax=Arabis alpina TaxID=50452 RepID=A0A087GIQ5_ARAAL|nr:hypothetical protein AALP_AA7G175100 [Arabis alpina]